MWRFSWRSDTPMPFFYLAKFSLSLCVGGARARRWVSQRYGGEIILYLANLEATDATVRLDGGGDPLCGRRHLRKLYNFDA